MEYKIADRMAALKPSVIREIFKHASDPSVISLAAGSPATETLPVEHIRSIMAEIFAEEGAVPLLYSQSEGYPPLRAALRDYLRQAYGIGREFDDLLVVSGAQQCMDLICRTLCDEGDVILCEEPSFIGSLNCFRSYGVRLVGIPLEPDGMDVQKLEEALRANPNTRLIYTIPNFQNPTGITTSLAKRRALYELARRYGVLVLEDNPYGDLRFKGEDVASIKSMDADGLVLYAGTFSKILSPGIRVGYLVAPSALTGKLVVAKQCADVHTAMPSQLLALRFLQQTDIQAHLQRLRAVYRHKCGLMLEQMDAHFPRSVQYTRPDGGLFVWATLPAPLDGAEFAARLLERKRVAVVPGSAFCTADGTCSASLRLNFSTPSDDAIETGIARMGELLGEYLQ